MQDSLQLRFSLVGGMFDTVQRSSSTTTEWAILLLQLVTYGVIDLNNNPELFTTVVDMLATLIHSTLISDSQSDRSDENKKHYLNLMKKLKKVDFLFECNLKLFSYYLDCCECPAKLLLTTILITLLIDAYYMTCVCIVAGNWRLNITFNGSGTSIVATQ